MKPFVRSGDFWSGIVLAALGAYIVGQARGWVYMAEDGPGAGFFPMWYGAVMIVLSLALVATSILRPAAGKPVVWNDLGRALGFYALFELALDLARPHGLLF